MEEGTSKSPSCCPDTDDAYDARQWDTREDCEVRQILDRVADKWSLLVIALLDSRTLRFTELSREIDGVSQRMLTVTLRHLERDGLVRRTVHPVVPPRVDYELTPLGVTLHDTIQSLVTWTEKHQNEIAAARAGYDARADTAPVATGPAPSARTGHDTVRVVVARGDGIPPATPLRNETPATGPLRNETRPSAPSRNETRGVLPPRNEIQDVASARNEIRDVVPPRDEIRDVVPAREESGPGADLSRCEVCGDPIRVARTGRPARFCGTACRQRAHRRRSRAALPTSG
ncbi:winged helix-turn-helix transcriptional regulator [Streptosporangium sp. V21-05]|uniref:winged helix-turn-helix transcriptional regulator n=1 Tax=Streptosporangium sp. V21-05 TaxID=3446115 RepID=UPI003F537E9C